MGRKKKQLKLIPILLIPVLIGALVFAWQVLSPKEYEKKYAASKYPTINLYNEKNEIIDEIVRGEEIEVLYSKKSPNDDKKISVKYNDKYAYINIDNITESKDKVRQEEKIYVTHFTHLRDDIRGKLKEPVSFGDQLDVTGGEILENGEVKWYKVNYKGEVRYVLSKYVSVDQPKEKKTVFPEPYQDLEYFERELKDYPSNPRRDDVKALYVSIWKAPNIDYFIEYAKETKVNALVIDIKYDNGTLLFHVPGAEEYAENANKNIIIKNMESYMQKLKDNGIYVIGRLVAFKGDEYFLQTNPDSAVIVKSTGQPYRYSGSVFLSGYNRKLWEYNVLVAKEAARLGFNEIQFDYVRFGEKTNDENHDSKNIYNETRYEAVGRFLEYAYDELSEEEVYVSADIFPDAMFSNLTVRGIGQYYPQIASIVDYTSLMIYPSHYGESYQGVNSPDLNPYEMVNLTIEKAFSLEQYIKNPAEHRHWLQGFTASYLPVGTWQHYGGQQAKEQIEALKDHNIDSWLFWNVSNNYDQIKEGLK